jgi:hypothetical protein
VRLPVVVDTNVAIVANGRADQAGPSCVLACVNALLDVVRRRRVIVDDGRIFGEYIRNLSMSGQPGVGDAFFKWIWDQQADPVCCTRVELTPHEQRGFEAFPDDAALTGFDAADRKFVAVAIASGESPPILNAADTDWWLFRKPLSRYGVTVEFLCPELMKED